MKKRNFKFLKLNKESISTLKDTKFIKGGTGTGAACQASEDFSCYAPCDSPFATRGCQPK